MRMQISDKLIKPLTEVKYLNADNVSRYRCIMRMFWKLRKIEILPNMLKWIKMLDKITDQTLSPVAKQIAKEKLAWYQENITDFLKIQALFQA